MNEPKTCLMTKDTTERRTPPIVPSLLWVLLCLVMWLWAISGPLLIVGGVASYFVDLRDVLDIPPGREALLFGGVLGGVGVSFVWLRMRGYIKFCGE
jgi:hypothetical protein